MRIVLVQLAYLGDVVLTTPLIDVIREQHPGAELWMMVTPGGNALVRHDPRLSGTIVYDKRGRDRGARGLLRLARTLRKLSFDAAYSPHRSFRTALLLAMAKIPERVGFRKLSSSWLFTRTLPRPALSHDVERTLALLENPPHRRPLRLYAQPVGNCKPEVRQLIEAGAPYTVLVPGSAWATKRWHVSRYREVALQLLAEGRRVMVVGAANERDVCAEVSRGLACDNLCGRVSLEELVVIIRNAALVVCNDSMALHVASAFGTPTVAVFCATSPSFGFGPWMNERARVAEVAGLWCKPCRRHGSRSCPTGTEICMRDLPSSQVLALAREVSQ